MIDYDRARARVRRDLARECEHVRVRGHAERDDVGGLCEILHGRRRRDAELGGDRFGFRVAAIPDGGEKSRAREMAGHRMAHRAEAGECDFEFGHSLLLLDCWKRDRLPAPLPQAGEVDAHRAAW